MTITFDLNELGIVTLRVPEDKVLTNVEALNLLGFEVEVTLD